MIPFSYGESVTYIMHAPGGDWSTETESKGGVIRLMKQALYLQATMAWFQANTFFTSSLILYT